MSAKRGATGTASAAGAAGARPAGNGAQMPGSYDDGLLYSDDYGPYGESVPAEGEAFSGPGSFVRTPLLLSPRMHTPVGAPSVLQEWQNNSNARKSSAPAPHNGHGRAASYGTHAGAEMPPAATQAMYLNAAPEHGAMSRLAEPALGMGAAQMLAAAAAPNAAAASAHTPGLTAPAPSPAAAGLGFLQPPAMQQQQQQQQVQQQQQQLLQQLHGDAMSVASSAAENAAAAGTGSLLAPRTVSNVGRVQVAGARNELFAAGKKPNIMMTGLPRSGKTSILSVLFQKVSPHETLFLDSSDKVVKHEIENSAFCQFQLWDVPGVNGSSNAANAFSHTGASLSVHSVVSNDSVFSDCAAVIFVIDVTSEETDEALQRLHHTITRAVATNPNVFIEVFIHKADALTEEQKVQCQRELQGRIDEELEEVGLPGVSARIRYRATSIFDHSVYEAFSQVVQNLIPETHTLESMLDFLVNNCGMEKAFLFDVVSKLYVATDSTPVHPEDFELCSDMIEVIIDVSCIYDSGLQDAARASGNAQWSGADAENAGTGSGGGGNGSSSAAAADSNRAPPPPVNFGYQTHSSATIRLSNNMVLYLKEVSNYLALCCIVRSDVFDAALGLIEYNVGVFKEGLQRVIQYRVDSNR